MTYFAFHVSNARLWISLILFHLCVLGTALYYQYFEQTLPCVLCVYIRLIFVSLLGLCILQMFARRLNAIHGLLLPIQLVIAGWGISIADELHQLQVNPSPFATCSFFPEFWIPLEQYLPWMFEPQGSCTDDIVLVLGLSMARWSMILLASYGAVLVALTYKTLRHR